MTKFFDSHPVWAFVILVVSIVATFRLLDILEAAVA